MQRLVKNIFSTYFLTTPLLLKTLVYIVSYIVHVIGIFCLYCVFHSKRVVKKVRIKGEKQFVMGRFGLSVKVEAYHVKIQDSCDSNPCFYIVTCWGDLHFTI